MAKIYLFPKNARTMPEHELETLLDELKLGQPDLTSEYVWYETRAYAVTLWEILTIYVGVKAADAAIGATVGKLVEAIIDKGKSWVERHRRANDSHHRPFALTVRDADGKVLAAIDIDRNGSAEDATAARPPIEPPPFDLMHDDTH